MMMRPTLRLVGERQFIFHPCGSSFDGSLRFDWLSLDSTVPSLHGTIKLHRFGPIVLLVVRARFKTAGDIVGRLLSESVGETMARASLGYLRHAIDGAIGPAAEREHAMR